MFDILRNKFGKYLVGMGLLASLYSLDGCAREYYVKESKTNKGKVTFIDKHDKEKVNIKVIDSKTKESLEDIIVEHHDGKGFEAFILQDPSGKYLPTIRVYPHNSEHVIEMGEKDNGTYSIQVIRKGEESTALYLWEDKFGLRSEKLVYLDTINSDEVLEMQEREEMILEIALKTADILTGTEAPFDFDEKLKKILKFVQPDALAYKRWDVYLKKGSIDVVFVIPSNIPTVEINNPQIKDGNVFLSWNGEDKDFYERSKGLIERIKQPEMSTQRDLTVLLGDSKDSDLKYNVTIKRDGEVSFKKTITDTNFKLGRRDGKYGLIVEVEDEVGNKSLSVLSFNVINKNIENVFKVNNRKFVRDVEFVGDIDSSSKYSRFLINKFPYNDIIHFPTDADGMHCWGVLIVSPTLDDVVKHYICDKYTIGDLEELKKQIGNLPEDPNFYFYIMSEGLNKDAAISGIAAILETGEGGLRELFNLASVESVPFLKQLVDIYPNSKIADDVLYFIGELCESFQYEFNNIEVFHIDWENPKEIKETIDTFLKPFNFEDYGFSIEKYGTSGEYHLTYDGRHFKQLVRDYSNSEFTDDAEWELIITSDSKWIPEKLIKLAKEFLKKYPNSNRSENVKEAIIRAKDMIEGSIE